MKDRHEFVLQACSTPLVGVPAPRLGVESIEPQSGDILHGFIGFGAMHVTKPYKFIWFGDIHGPKPYEFLGFRWARISQTPVVKCAASQDSMSAAEIRVLSSGEQWRGLVAHSNQVSGDPPCSAQYDFAPNLFALSGSVARDSLPKSPPKQRNPVWGLRASFVQDLLQLDTFLLVCMCRCKSSEISSGTMLTYVWRGPRC